MLNIHENLKSLPSEVDFEINKAITEEYGEEGRKFLEHFCRKLTAEERGSIYAVGHANGRYLFILSELACDREDLIRDLRSKIMSHAFMYDNESIVDCCKYTGNGIKIVT